MSEILAKYQSILFKFVKSLVSACDIKASKISEGNMDTGTFI